MTQKQIAALWFLIGILASSGVLRLSRTHADAIQPALDRQLVERMVRALEQQVSATDKLTQATERAGERCKR